MNVAVVEAEVQVRNNESAGLRHVRAFAGRRGHILQILIEASAANFFIHVDVGVHLHHCRALTPLAALHIFEQTKIRCWFLDSSNYL